MKEEQTQILRCFETVPFKGRDEAMLNRSLQNHIGRNVELACFNATCELTAPLPPPYMFLSFCFQHHMATHIHLPSDQ